MAKTPITNTDGKPADNEKKPDPKPTFNEAEATADPWKGRGGAYTLDENGKRVPVSQ